MRTGGTTLETGLGDFVDQAKDPYEQVDQNLGGWLPFGAESPEQAAPEATPDMYGYEAPPEGAGESWGGQQWPGRVGRGTGVGAGIREPHRAVEGDARRTGSVG